MGDNRLPLSGRGPRTTIVVGAGVVGLWTALELARAGCEVRVVERDRIGAGASHGNAGVLASDYLEPLATPASVRAGLGDALRRNGFFKVVPHAGLGRFLLRFALSARQRRAAAGGAALRSLGSESLQSWLDLDDELDGALAIARRGFLVVPADAAALALAASRAGAIGADVVVLDPDATASALGAAACETAGSLLWRRAGHLDPAAGVAALAAAVRDAGVEILTGVECLDWQSERKQIEALTSVGRMRADHLVLATGPAAPGVDLRGRVEAGQGYSCDYAIESSLAQPVLFERGHFVATPLPVALRITGALELAGPLPPFNATRMGNLATVAAGELGLNDSPERYWRGLRSCAADGMPLVGPIDTDRRAWLAVGHGMAG